MFALLILYCTIIYQFHAQRVTCTGKSPCNCPTTSKSSAPCVLDCGQIDGCKEATLNCRDADSCIIQCDAIATCSDYVTINALTAGDVTIICDAIDACKVGIDIICGTGHCELQCNTDKSCIDFGNIDVTASASFHCTGNYCPDNIPPPFTTSPTSRPISNHPSESPTSNPIHKPTANPLQSPSSNPTIYPSFIPTIFISSIPTKYPTKNPSSNPTYIPTLNPSISVTEGITSNPTNLPTSNPSNPPILSQTTSHPSSVLTLSPSNTWNINTERSETDYVSEKDFDAVDTNFDIISTNSIYYMIGILMSGCCYIVIACCFCVYFTHIYSEKRNDDIIPNVSNNTEPGWHQIPHGSVSINPSSPSKSPMVFMNNEHINSLEDCGEASLQMNIDDNELNPVSLMEKQSVCIVETVTYHHYPNKPSQACIPSASNQIHSMNDIDQSPTDDSNHTFTLPTIPPSHCHLDAMNGEMDEFPGNHCVPIVMSSDPLDDSAEHKTADIEQRKAPERMDLMKEEIEHKQQGEMISTVCVEDNVNMIDVLSLNLEANDKDICNISISNMSIQSGNEIPSTP